MEKWCSVIIPHYNSAELLEKLVRSIPSDPGIEVIVVDDKSNQELERLQVVESWIKEQGHIFLHNETEKKGAGVCRNIALEVASGEWLLFADADDFFLENAFEHVKKACELGKDLIYFPPTSSYLDDGKIADRHVEYERWVVNYYNNPTLKNELLLRYKFMIPSNKLIKRSEVENIRFDEVIVSNDVMFSIKTAHKIRNIGVYPETIYCLTKSSNTLTTKKSKANVEVRVKVFINRYVYLKEHLKEEEFELLGLSGKALMLQAFLDGHGIGFVLWIYKEYRKNGIKVFSVKGIKKDFNEFLRMLKMKRKDTEKKI